MEWNTFVFGLRENTKNKRRDRLERAIRHKSAFQEDMKKEEESLFGKVVAENFPNS